MAQLSERSSTTEYGKKSKKQLKKERIFMTREGIRIMQALMLDSGKAELLSAAELGEANLMEILMSHPSYESDSVNHQVALSRAAQHGRVSAVELLLKVPGVQPDYVDHTGRTPLTWAVDYLPRMDKLVDVSSHHKVIEILLQQKNVHPDTKGSTDGRTILSLASEYGDITTVDLLLQRYDVDLESRDLHQDRMPLSWSLEFLGNSEHSWSEGSGHYQVVQSLLKRHPTSPDLVLIEGQTLLARACQFGAVPIIRLLLNQGHVDPNLSSNGRTPLSWAIKLLEQKDYARAWIDEPYEAIQLLLDQETLDPNLDSEGMAPLLRATTSGDARLVAMLLNKSNLNVNAKYDDGQTSLSRAVGLEYEEIVRLLLKDNRADANTRDNEQRTPLIWAVEVDNLIALSLLLATSNIECNAIDMQGRTPLSRAAQCGKMHAVQLLLSDDRVLCNTIDESHRTPLWWAVDAGHDGVVGLLLASANIDLEQADGIGRAPLLRAAQLGHKNIVQMFLNIEGIDHDARDDDNRTPLWCAAEAGHEEVVKKLLRASAVNPDATSNSGHTPLLRAAQCDHWKVVQQLLKDHRISPDVRDHNNRTPLFLAASAGSESTVYMLLEEKKVNPMATDLDGLTPLAAAASRKRLEVTRALLSRDPKALHTLVRVGNRAAIIYLLENSYDINSTDEHGRTSLHIAALMGNSEIVKDLLFWQADSDAVDANGVTPLHLAIQYKQEDVIKYLLEKSEKLTDIMFKDWLDIFGKNASTVLRLFQDVDGKKHLDSLNSINRNEIEGKAIFFCTDHHDWSKHLSWFPNSHIRQADSQISYKIQPQGHRKGVDVYLIGRLPSRAAGKQETFAVSQSRQCAIAWTMVQSSLLDGASWRPVHFYSSLPYGWMPNDGTDFFRLFIRHLKDNWLTLCSQAEEHLAKRRLDQLHEKGNSQEMIHRLAEDAQEWAKLRTMLRGQKNTTTEFIIAFCLSYDQGQDKRNMQDALNQFNSEVTDQIDLLDQTVKELLQFEFAWVSINEAHKSTSLATSMKRLSWITFIFLPAMFASSLFGMNVNILENNPDWRWFMLFVGCLLTITVVVWLFFKYGQVEKFVERNLGARFQQGSEYLRNQRRRKKSSEQPLPT